MGKRSRMRPFAAASDDELLRGPDELPVEEDRELEQIVSRFTQYRELDTEYDER